MGNIASEYYDKPVTVVFIYKKESSTYSNITKIVVRNKVTILFRGEISCESRMVAIIPNKYLIDVY